MRLIVRLLRLIRACLRLILLTLAPDFVGLHLRCAFFCACLRLLLRLLALALAPDLDQARDQAQTLALPLALARALSLRLLLRLLPRLMVNPSWVVHFHFIFVFLSILNLPKSFKSEPGAWSFRSGHFY